MLAVCFLVLITSCIPVNLLQSGLCPSWFIHHSSCWSPLTSIMLNSAFSSIAQHPLTFSQPIHAESSPMPPRSTSSGGNRSPERGSLEGNCSVKQWSISTYLPSHTELIHLWISGMFILHNVESSGCFSHYLLEFYHISYYSSSLLELFLAWFVWFQSSCFSTTSQAAPSHPLRSLLSFTDHLAVCTPQYLFLVLCSLVSLCNLFWGVLLTLGPWVSQICW